MPDTGSTGAAEVLLAIKDGEPFLAQQLDSLLNQTFQNFVVIVSDDGSRDRSLAILEDYRARHPAKFRILDPAGKPLGASGNFARLLSQAQADYIFFCDQDDVWLPTKMADSLARMHEAERASPPGTPLLVHTDLSVVDAQLRVLGESFFQYSGVDPTRNSLSAMLLGNIATGCTVLANRHLYQIAAPIPSEVLMYDMWLAQIASAIGKLICLPQATVLYRQHDHNTIGADRAGTAGVLRRLHRTMFSDRSLRVLTSYSRHAALLLERCGDRMSVPDRERAQTMATLWELPPWRRFARLRRAGLRKANTIAEIGLALLVLRTGEPVRAREP